jgi:hypothetical protein
MLSEPEGLNVRPTDVADRSCQSEVGETLMDPGELRAQVLHVPPQLSPRITADQHSVYHLECLLYRRALVPYVCRVTVSHHVALLFEKQVGARDPQSARPAPALPRWDTWPV